MRGGLRVHLPELNLSLGKENDRRIDKESAVAGASWLESLVQRMVFSVESQGRTQIPNDP